MRLHYDQPALWRARTDAEGLGHRFRGRFTRVRHGLSWELSCLDCHWPVVVVPAWHSWETADIFGDAVRMSCPVSKAH